MPLRRWRVVPFRSSLQLELLVLAVDLFLLAPIMYFACVLLVDGGAPLRVIQQILEQLVERRAVSLWRQPESVESSARFILAVLAFNTRVLYFMI